MVEHAIAKGENTVDLVEHAASGAGKQSPSIIYDEHNDRWKQHQHPSKETWWILTNFDDSYEYAIVPQFREIDEPISPLHFGWWTNDYFQLRFSALIPDITSSRTSQHANRWWNKTWMRAEIQTWWFFQNESMSLASIRSTIRTPQPFHRAKSKHQPMLERPSKRCQSEPS